MIPQLASTIARHRAFSQNLGHLRWYHALVFKNFGPPTEELSFTTIEEKEQLKKDEIRLRILAAPINPSDLNTIEGTYPLKPAVDQWSLPAVAGHEGVGRVTERGSAVQDCNVGDLVVPVASHQGTWTEEGVYKACHWHRVPSDLSVESAATMSINPPTALCMLRDFASLKPGDAVVQNGATSAVGQAVIQIAKAQGLQTINIVRSRPHQERTAAYLKSLGATLVETEENILAAFASSGLPLGSLGLNCIGGQSASLVSRLLKKGSTMVTYGGMSKKPLTIPTSALIFKDLTFRGFWWSGRTSAQLGLKKKAELIDYVAALIRNGSLHTQTEKFSLADYQAALKRQDDPYRENKILLTP